MATIPLANLGCKWLNKNKLSKQDQPHSKLSSQALNLSKLLFSSSFFLGLITVPIFIYRWHCTKTSLSSYKTTCSSINAFIAYSLQKINSLVSFVLGSLRATATLNDSHRNVWHVALEFKKPLMPGLVLDWHVYARAVAIVNCPRLS
jgi:hypothetical protein